MNSNLKWLLLIPVFAVAVAIYLIPTVLLNEDGSGDNTTTASSQAVKIQLDDLQERINAYQALLQRNPDDFEAIKGIGDSYLEMGAYLREDGSTNESYGNYKKAVDQYRKYLAMKPDDVEVRTDLGLAYSYLQMIDIAIRELRTATAADPENQRAWHSLGWVLYNSAGDETGATEAWQKSYDIDPHSTVCLLYTSPSPRDRT